ncbi:MAG TPA: hypothetical protein PLP51_00225 [Acholeplasmataceae bacterium]|jgi:hypothetical protein|nr:hypothetical protein [Acholeplasmataceae bacterium]HPX71602.1 hypothetical protein [Acholeplasmataceae bacterium]HQC30144.1 hypothetical protein [Acholeplasmataceae bacterium]
MKKFKRILLIIIVIFGIFAVSGCKKKETEQQRVEKIITEVYKTHRGTFIMYTIDDIVFDYNAIAAITLLNKKGYDFDLTKVLAEELVVRHINNAEIKSENDAFKLMILAKAYNLEMPSKVVDYTANLTQASSFYAYPVILSLIENFKNNDALLNQILAAIPTVHTNDWFDTDTAAFILATTTKYDNVDKSNLQTLLDDATTVDGVLGWDGKYSASSTAMALIANTSNGKMVSFSGESNLADALVKFYDAEQKGFKSNLEAEEIDVTFATPQAFAALSLYLLMLKGEKAPNLYY